MNQPERIFLSSARKVLRYVIGETSKEKEQLGHWINTAFERMQPDFSSHLYSETGRSNILIKEVKPTYDSDAAQVDARIILRDNFDAIFSNHPETLIFGEGHR